MSKRGSTLVPSSNAVLSFERVSLPRLVLISMRPHQWVKNLFVFAPVLFGGKLTDIAALGSASLAFCTFCLLSSSLYMVNDCVDAREDRSHPEKRNRPISSGSLTVTAAMVASLFLVATGMLLALFVGGSFAIIAAAYYVLILAYCVLLKRIAILDCIVIASGFVLRVVGGAVAINVMPTHWLIVCAFLLALFLAFSKRRQELLILSASATQHRSVLGRYSIAYLEQVNVILIGASIVSYALYTVAQETVERFGTDTLIYGTVFVIYGMFRYLLLINDPKKGGNPSTVLVSDKPLIAALLAWGMYNSAIIYRMHFATIYTSLFG